MKLIICGNGFDLHHKLKTDYPSYRNFLEHNYKNALHDFESFPYFNISKSQLWSDLESTLEIDYEMVMEDVLSEFKLDLTDDRDSRWYDFVIDMELATKFIYDFTGSYFYEWINDISYNLAETDKNLNCMDINNIYLNFNYTNTLEKLYNIDRNNILYIHGNISDIQTAHLLNNDILPNYKSIEDAEVLEPIAKRNLNNSEIIRTHIQFGSIVNDSKIVKEELEQKYNEVEFFEASIRPGINELARFCEASTKRLDKNYRKLRKFIDYKNIDEVVVMGHSILGVDISYYNYVIIPLFCNLEWTLYYHTDDDLDKCNKFIKKYAITNFSIVKW